MIIDKNTALGLARTPRTGSTTICVNTSNTLSLKTSGNRVVELAGALPVAKPTVVDPYNSATGYTFSASVASATSILSDKDYGNVNITSSLAGIITTHHHHHGQHLLNFRHFIISIATKHTGYSAQHLYILTRCKSVLYFWRRPT